MARLQLVGGVPALTGCPHFIALLGNIYARVAVRRTPRAA
jgi:hypothetical protein